MVPIWLIVRGLLNESPDHLIVMMCSIIVHLEILSETVKRLITSSIVMTSRKSINGSGQTRNSLYNIWCLITSIRLTYYSVLDYLKLLYSLLYACRTEEELLLQHFWKFWSIPRLSCRNNFLVIASATHLNMDINIVLKTYAMQLNQLLSSDYCWCENTVGVRILLVLVVLS